MDFEPVFSILTSRALRNPLQHLVTACEVQLLMLISGHKKTQWSITLCTYKYDFYIELHRKVTKKRDTGGEDGDEFRGMEGGR